MDGLWRRHRGSALGWAVTRAALVATTMAGVYPQQQHVSGDVSRYAAWSAVMAHGRLPAADPAWQYPPLAAVPMLVARVVPGHFLVAFVVEMLVVDAVGWLLLARHRPLSGPWLWVLGLAALGPVTWYRFDLVPAVLAVAALGVRRGGWAGGLLAAAGAWVKVWPAVVLPVLRRPVVAVTTAVVASGLGVAALALTGRLHEATTFVHHEGTRGLQVESVAATPIVALVAWAHHVPARFGSGSYEFTGGTVPAVDDVSAALSVFVVVGFLAAAVAAARRGRPLAPAGATLTVVLALVVVARVLSPQYLVWLVAVAAVALALGEARVGPAAVMVVGAAAASQVLYPSHYVTFLHGGGFEAVVLVVRNAALVVALALSLRAVRGEPDRQRSAYRSGRGLAPP